MADINSVDEINNLDPKKINTSLKFFADQCLQGWEEVMDLTIPDNYSQTNHVVCFAMGGSRLGAVVASNVLREELEIPFSFFAGYDVPNFVDENTLAIIVSVSGNTEETISSYNQAKERTEKIIVITAGGRLGEMATADNYPMYKIDDAQYNPSRVPRVAVGFQLGAYFAILSKLGLMNLTSDEFSEILNAVKAKAAKLEIDKDVSENQSKKVAEKLQGKIPIIIASEHLFGAANTINNQVNESGKNFSAFFELPEVNHHQLEGMQFPSSNPENLIYFLLESDLYHERISKRYGILKQILDDLGIEYVSYKPKGESKIAQALEAVQFGGYMTYYLGLLNDVDPAPNPFVDKFKELLS